MTHEIGIFPGIPEADYRAAEGICQSSLKECGISMLHYLNRTVAPPEPPTDAQIIGTLTHRAVLEKDFSGYVVRPEGMKFTTKEGKEWRAANPGVVVDYDIRLISNAVWNHDEARAILSAQGSNEVSCWKEDDETGLLLKGRADRVTTDAQGYTVVADLKTCGRGEGDIESFSKSIFSWGYHHQAFFYQKLLFEASFFVYIVVEKEPPFAVACYSLDAESLELGGRDVRRWLNQVAECKTSGVWPGYAMGIRPIGVPKWVKDKLTS